MTLTLFFRLIQMSIFQSVVAESKNINYNNTFFYCPRIICKDGWDISLQINNRNYCESNNGYRTFGDTIVSVEFGFPSTDDNLLHQYCEGFGYVGYDVLGNELPFDSTNFSAVDKIGMVPISTIQFICDNNHGGIDWDETISAKQFHEFINYQI